jgi:hypothetical protein
MKALMTFVKGKSLFLLVLMDSSLDALLCKNDEMMEFKPGFVL